MPSLAQIKEEKPILKTCGSLSGLHISPHRCGRPLGRGAVRGETRGEDSSWWSQEAWGGVGEEDV